LSRHILGSALLELTDAGGGALDPRRVEGGEGVAHARHLGVSERKAFKQQQQHARRRYANEITEINLTKHDINCKIERLKILIIHT
jgi:hypothetical protein